MGTCFKLNYLEKEVMPDCYIVSSCLEVVRRGGLIEFCGLDAWEG